MKAIKVDLYIQQQITFIDSVLRTMNIILMYNICKYTKSVTFSFN